MASSRQIRAARALLGWTQQTLADHALVAINTVRAIERDRPHPKEDTIEAVVKTLEKRGISFFSDGSAIEGVQLLLPRNSRTKK